MTTTPHANAPIVTGAIREVIEIYVANRIKHELDHDDSRLMVTTPNRQKAAALLGGLHSRSDVPISAKQRGNVEEYRFADTEHYGVNRRAWWGFPDDLVALGVATPGQVRREKCWSKSGKKEGVGGWSVMHAPSGRAYFFAYDQKPSKGLVARRARIEAIQRAERLGEILEPICTDGERTTCWFGRRQDLIAAGICDESRFPIGKGRIVYGYETKPHWRTERVSGEYFQYVIDKAESDVRKPQPERGPEYESPEAYREYAEDWVGRFACGIRRLVANEIEAEKFDMKTLAYDKDTVRRVCEAAELIEQILQAGSVGWTREQKEKMNLAASSKSDKTFQSFLSGVVGK